MDTSTAPRGATRRYTIDLDLDLRRRLRVAASQDDLVLSDVVRELLEQWLRDRAAKVSTPVTEAGAKAQQVSDAAPVRPAWVHRLDPRAARIVAEAEARRARRAGLPTVPPTVTRG